MYIHMYKRRLGYDYKATSIHVDKEKNDKNSLNIRHVSGHVGRSVMLTGMYIHMYIYISNDMYKHIYIYIYIYTQVFQQKCLKKI